MKIKSNSKFIVLALAASILTISCNNDETEDIANSKVPMQFTAVQDKIETNSKITKKNTRTTLQDDGFSVGWLADDAIAIFPEGQQDNPDKFIAQNASHSSIFSGSTTQATTYRALFPYNEYATYSDGKFHTNLSSYQVVKDNNMADEASIAVATLTNANLSLTDNNLQFKNACSMLKITFKYAAGLSQENRKKITQISIASTKRENKIAGEAVIGPDGNCVIDTNDESGIIVKKEYGAPFTEGTAYYVVMPAQTINGFVVTFKTETVSDTYYEYSVTVKNPVDFKRNKIQKLNVEIKNWEPHQMEDFS